MPCLHAGHGHRRKEAPGGEAPDARPCACRVLCALGESEERASRVAGRSRLLARLLQAAMS